MRLVLIDKCGSLRDAEKELTVGLRPHDIFFIGYEHLMIRIVYFISRTVVLNTIQAFQRC